MIETARGAAYRRAARRSSVAWIAETLTRRPFTDTPTIETFMHHTIDCSWADDGMKTECYWVPDAKDRLVTWGSDERPHMIVREGHALRLRAHEQEEVDRETAIMGLGGRPSCDCFDVCWLWRQCLRTLADGDRPWGLPAPISYWLGVLEKEVTS